MFQLLGYDFTTKIKKVNHKICRRVDVVVRASASQLVDLGLIYLVESYQKTLLKGFLLGAQFKGSVWEINLLVVSLDKTLNEMSPSLCGRQMMGPSSLPLVMVQCK